MEISYQPLGKSFTPSATRELDQAEPVASPRMAKLSSARGVMIGLLLAIPLWVAIVIAVLWWSRQ